MNDKPNTRVASQPPTKRRWETPRVESSEVFTRAGLACCIDVLTNTANNSGASLPICG